jgi:hypothetical protein
MTGETPKEKEKNIHTHTTRIAWEVAVGYTCVVSYH